jgi:hypothetical protein
LVLAPLQSEDVGQGQKILAPVRFFESSIADMPEREFHPANWAIRFCSTNPTGGLQGVTKDGGHHHLRGTQPSDAGCQVERIL